MRCRTGCARTIIAKQIADLRSVQQNVRSKVNYPDCTIWIADLQSNSLSVVYFII